MRLCKNKLIKHAVTALLVMFIGGCGHVGDYLRFVDSRNDLKRTFRKEPCARLLNELNPEGSFIVQGRLVFNKEQTGPILVLAVTDRYKPREVVTEDILQTPVEFYQTLLPEGRYDLYFLADLDGNGYFEAAEVIGMTSGMPVHVCKERVGDGATITGPPIELDLKNPATADFPVRVQVREARAVYASLDDPFFDPEYGRMGLYDPKALLAHTRRLFFTLEKIDPEKTLILFVHGADGTPRDFKCLVADLDRSRYQPGFFFYPSGLPLQKLGTMLAVFLRNIGETRNCRPKSIIVVAHSMGGLVALSGLDQLCVDGVPSYIKGFVSFNCPYGGVTMPPGFESVPVVVPSWRDLVPGSTFLEQLYQGRVRQEFPFYLFFGYETGQSDDGSITLQSQLEPKVHVAASKTYGFNSSHLGILNDDAVRQTFYRALATL